MANMEENLTATITQAQTDGELFHKIVHGNTTTAVVTENGIVPSVAKQLKDTHDEIVNGCADYLGSCLTAKSETIAVRDNAVEIQSAIEQLKTDTTLLKNTTEEFKNQTQTTYNNVATAVSDGISSLQTEGSNQLALVQTAATEQIRLATAQANRAENATSSKANLDFSNINPTPNAILSIINWLVPDWTRRSVLDLNTDVTITQYGWILMRNIVYTSSINGYINGNQVFKQYGRSGYWEEYNSLSFLVGPGDVVKLTGGELTFIPCKGA